MCHGSPCESGEHILRVLRELHRDRAGGWYTVRSRALMTLATAVLALTGAPGLWSAAQAYAADWPLPRGNPYATGASAAPGPIRPDVVWRHDVFARPSATPVADSERTVYVAEATGEDTTVRALELTAGGERWQCPTAQAVAGRAVEGESVYACVGDGTVLLLDRSTGQMRGRAAGLGAIPEGSCGGLVPLRETGVFVSASAALQALSADPFPIAYLLLPGDGSLLVALQDAAIHCLRDPVPPEPAEG